MNSSRNRFQDKWLTGILLFAASSVLLVSLFYIDRQLAQSEGPWGVIHFKEQNGRESIAVQDFSFFWHTGHAWRTSPSTSPYQSGKHLQQFKNWTQTDNSSLVMPYFYAPLHLYLFATISLVPVRIAYLMLAVLTILGCAVGIWWLMQKNFHSQNVSRWIPLIAFASIAYMQVIHIGQMSIIFLILLFGFARLVSVKNDARSASSGLFLFLLAMKPPLALPLLIWTVAQKKYRAAGWFTVCCILLVITSPLFLGWNWISDYFSNITAFSSPLEGSISTGGSGGSSHTNLRNVINLLFSPLATHASLISYALWALAIIPLFLRKPSDPSSAYLLGYALMTYLLFSPHLNRSDDLLLALPLYIAGLTLRFGSPASWSYLIAGVLLFFLPFASLGSWMIIVTWTAKAALTMWLACLAFQSSDPEPAAIEPAVPETPTDRFPSAHPDSSAV
ncbi:MAG: glycosyltransferase family 87 protein [Verrucomicrobiota bacterium]